MDRTYLHTCLKDDHLCRWPDGTMPIHVYIAPFVWYEKKKQQESHLYRQLVLESLEAWRKASNGLVRFQIVDNLNSSQIDFKWRRVDRKTLGHCTYELDKQYRLFSAEIQIGISDGLLHARYHTLSPRDMDTVSWLYSLPVGFNYKSVAAKYQLKTNYTISDVINRIEQRIKGGSTASLEAPAETAPSFAVEPHESAPARSDQTFARMTRSLDEQHEILSEMGRFYLKTQNIQVSKDKQDHLRRVMMEKKLQERFQPPEI
jgi:hypothetical protein